MSEVKKVLIHLPSNVVDVLDTLSFLVTVRNYYPEAQLNLLCENDYSEIIKPAFENFEFHTISEDNYRNFLSIHKYAFNLIPIFNIDLSFSLRAEWKSPFLAFCFRSRNRLGVYNLRAKPFLTQSKKYEELPSPGKLGFDLLSLFTKAAVKRAELQLPEFEIDDEDSQDYEIIDFVFHPNELKNVDIQNKLIELSSQLEDIKFRFFQFDHLPLPIEEISTDEDTSWKEMLCSNNKYEFSNLPSRLNEIIHKASYSKAVITTNPVVNFYTNYLSTPSFFLKSDAINMTEWNMDKLADNISEL